MSNSAPVWNFFDKKADNPNKAICKVCNKEYSCPGGTTSSLSGHLKQHSDAFKEFEQLKKKRPAVSSSINVTSKQSKLEFPTSNAATQKLLDTAVVDFLAESHSAFRVVDLPSFKNMFKIANPKITIKSREFYSKLITKHAHEMVEDLQSIIEFVKNDVTTFSFSTDMWTSSNNDAFICLNITFITKEWSMVSFTPYVRPFPARHTGANISVCLDEMIESLKLNSSDFVLLSVNDNASNMHLAIELSEHLIETNCSIHTLELVVKDGVKNTQSVINVLKKSKGIAKYVNKSTVATTDLKKACEECNIQFKKPVNPPNTRWCGFYKNLDSILHLKSALLYLNSEDNWKEHVLSVADWKLIEATSSLLKYFSETVLIFESESQPTMHEVIPRIFSLNERLSSFIESSTNVNAKKFAKELQKSLNKRFPNHGSENNFRRMANYLAPQYKGMHLNEFNKLEETYLDIKLLFQSTSNVTPVTASQTAISEAETLDLSPNSKMRRRFQAQKSSAASSSRVLENSCPFEKEFCRFDSFSLAPSTVNVLDWWKSHEKTLPLLSKVARSVLSIPCSSAKSERTFSCAGNFMNPKRNKLGLNKLENLVILKENKKPLLTIKSELPSDYTKISGDTFNQITLNSGGLRTNCDDIEHDLLCNDDDSDTLFSDDDDDDDNIDNIDNVHVLE